MVEPTDWRGLLRGRRRTDADITLKAVLTKGAGGSFGAFLGRADDGQHYYVKPIYSQRDRLVPITDQIVGRVGALLGAPVCAVRTIEIGDDLAGTLLHRGRILPPGIAHASLEVAGKVDVSLLSHMHRDEDDNRWRHAAFFALHDWCWGNDVHGLLDTYNDFQFYSHDLGNFLPPDGPGWAPNELVALVDEPHEYKQSVRGIPSETAAAVADRLAGISREEIREALAAVPSRWPIRNADLEVVGFFLERRASPTAERLRRRCGARAKRR